MFELRKKQKNDYALIILKRERFLSLLIKLMTLLKNSGNEAQSDFVYKLLELINQNNFYEFVKSVNGADMWGGSGAVWEVYIANKYEAKEFEKEMIGLVELLKTTKIMGKGIIPIKNIFEDNLRADEAE